jgi:DNA polymerase-3 subunit alpha
MVEERAPMLPRAGGMAKDGNEANLIKQLCTKGLKKRLRMEQIRAEQTGTYEERLSYELEMINNMGFAGYFLIVSEFINWAKLQGIAVGPGRGSGAGSVVAWVLGITDLDPIRFGLLFERFLNPERVSMPDFDIDFCQERRDEVITHVQEQYGKEQVAQIITFGKLQARAVMRDVGRVLGLPYGQVDRLCKLIPNNPAAPVTLQQALDGEPRLSEARNNESGVGRLIDIALKLEGLYRHASTHAAGVVIGDRPLDELVPLYRDPRSQMPVTQFNMKDVERAGLVKFDFLGLKTLTVLQRAVRSIAVLGSKVDLTNLPLDDKLTYELLSSGETVGVFQMESSGMREVLRKLKPDLFEDLIAVVALYRPGPMSNIPNYIERKHGRENVEFFHESLEPILQETYGIMIYQEQVMQIAQKLSGFTLGQADLLRRAMGKKDKEEMNAQRQRFIVGAENNGMARAIAVSTFDQVNAFAGYGFNKSHAAAYALVAYQTAFLKAHFPIQFMAALMTLEQGNTEKIGAFKQELSRLNIDLFPPDINKSSSEFIVEPCKNDSSGNAIRYALSAIKNVGVGAVEEIVAERTDRGNYQNLFDFSMRLGKVVLNKRQLANLAKAGAFDQMNSNRAQVVEASDMLIRHGDWLAEEAEGGQTSLFQGGDVDQRQPDLPVVEEWAPFVRLKEEADALGFYLSSHPLDAYGSSLSNLGIVSYSTLTSSLPSGNRTERAKLAAVVQKRRERNSNRGRYAFLEVSDQSGIYEITIFSDLLSQKRDLLEAGAALLLEVSVQREGESIRLIAQKIDELDDKIISFNNGFMVYIKEKSDLNPLKAVIQRDEGGVGQVWLVQRLAGNLEVEIGLTGRYSVSPALRAALKSVPGVIDVLDREKPGV